MSTVLRIRYVRIRTSDGWQDHYDLDAPVVAIVGPVDTGKSSLVDCIAFALGRDGVEFRGAVNFHLREVEIGLRIGSGLFVLKRSRKANSYIEVLDADQILIGHFPVRMPTSKKDDHQTISSWLLEQLNLDDTFSSVRLSGGKPLDFSGALLPYCYLTQDDIDRHIIQPPREDSNRLVALKLLLNLTTPEHERLNAEIRDADNAIERSRRQAQVIREFLASSSATNADDIRDEIAALVTAEAAAASRLAAWRNDARAASRLAEHERQQVAKAREAVGSAEDELDRLRKEYEKVRAKLAASKDGLEQLTVLENRSPAYRARLHFALTQCPECESSLTERVVSPGHCYLCGELLAGRKHDKERRRLESLRSEAGAREQALRVAIEKAETQANNTRIALAALREEADNRAGDSVTPFIDAIATASAELAGIRGRLVPLRRVLESNDRLLEQFKRITVMEAEQKERRERVQGQTGLERIDHVLDALNEIFRRIVLGIQLPHATGRARLDPVSFLPLVDDQAFRQRGGGARSAVSIAYSLTLLTYTLENALAKLPSLLIIDSPQKNFGSNRDDKELAHRVYERFLDHMDELRELKDDRFRRPFQLIIVDNDIHSDIRKRIKVHQFGRDKGFIRDLAHPHGLDGQAIQLSIEDVMDDWLEG